MSFVQGNNLIIIIFAPDHFDSGLTSVFRSIFLPGVKVNSVHKCELSSQTRMVRFLVLHWIPKVRKGDRGRLFSSGRPPL